jgi:hypothetical protein
MLIASQSFRRNLIVVYVARKVCWLGQKAKVVMSRCRVLYPCHNFQPLRALQTRQLLYATHPIGQQSIALSKPLDPSRLRHKQSGTLFARWLTLCARPLRSVMRSGALEFAVVLS